mmetsp:Transcript_102116/g.288386  ORF Transcript_102116/g.288386 Transcript_102116/m.288386 type:complete len:224 (+) Transcript_102116:80-751(+)
MPPGSAASRKGFFFDGQRWVAQDRATARQGPRAPEQFNLAAGDDDDDVASVNGRSCRCLCYRSARAGTIAFALGAAALFVFAQTSLLVPLLPTPEEWAHAGRVALEGSRRVPSGNAPPKAEELVRWNGLTPECLGQRFVVGPRTVILRASAAKDSQILGRLVEGTAVQREGPCTNHDGLVRVLVSVAGNATEGASGPQAGLRGWATLTAESVQGPRFFDRLPD